jgi:hypothetical protein
MTRSGRNRAVRAGLATRALAPFLLAALLGGCDEPFEPFRDNSDAPFSMFGYLDLRADTQWVRVTPVRQNLLAAAAPIDAVVTLENLRTGRTVTLRDSAFAFVDGRVGGTAHVHNFWTPERLEPGSTYRLRATRSDGASSSAVVELPSDNELTVTYFEGPPDQTRDGVDPFRVPLRLRVRGETLLYYDLFHTVWNVGENRPGEPIVLRQRPNDVSAGVHEFGFPSDTLRWPGVVNLRRREATVAVARADWPYRPGLSAVEAILPGVGPSNVENGLGFVGGVAIWRMPVPRCDPRQQRPDGRPVCAYTLGARPASIVGRVVGMCTAPSFLPRVFLTQRYAGGGAAVFEWRTDWSGSFEFVGLEPGAELVLEFEGIRITPAVRPAPLAPGERRVLPDVTLPIGCGSVPTGASRD